MFQCFKCVVCSITILKNESQLGQTDLPVGSFQQQTNSEKSHEVEQGYLTARLYLIEAAKTP